MGPFEVEHKEEWHSAKDVRKGSIRLLEKASVGYGTERITLDGDLREWAKVKSMPLPYQGSRTGSVKLCWRETGIYGAVAARDAKVAVNPERPHSADAFVLFIETTAAGRSDWQDAYMLQFFPAPDSGPGGAHIRPMGKGISETATVVARHEKTGVECSWAPTAQGYVLEFFLPAALLRPAQMQAGTEMRMNFVLLNDGQEIEIHSAPLAERASYLPKAWGIVELAR